MKEGDRVFIRESGHPWRGYTGTIVRRMRLSPITTEEGWRIELDSGIDTVARESALEKI